MKKLINSPQDVVRQELEGMEAAHGDRFRISYDPIYIVRRSPPAKGKVALISGGGSSGRPIILFPPAGKMVRVRRILVAWNATRESIRAVADNIDLFVSFRFAMWLRVAQVVGIGFPFVPITAAGYIGIPPEKGDVSRASSISCATSAAVSEHPS